MIAGRSRPWPEPTTIETSCTVVGVALPPRRSSTIAWRLPGGICSSVQRVAQLLARLVGAGEAEQLVLDLVERALGPGDLEQAAGVAVDACIVRHAPTSLRSAPSSLVRCAPSLTVLQTCSMTASRCSDLRMKSSMRRCWVSSSSERSTTRSAAADASRAISLRSSSDVRPAAAAMSASALASSSAISASSRARPSASSAAAWVSASASSRWRSPSMSPSAWRMRVGLGVGVGLRLGRLVELGLDALRAGGEGLLGQRPGLPDQQADDDHRGERAVDQLGPLGQIQRVDVT